MIVVADASPLRYLVAIGAADVLKTLYDRVLVPEAVAAELQLPTALGLPASRDPIIPPWPSIVGCPHHLTRFEIP